MSPTQDAIRAYLLLVSKKTYASSDPIARLHEYASAERGFCSVAKGYADANLIAVAAFEAMGVPQETLERAGLVPRSTDPFSLDATREAIRAIGAPFTIERLASELGCSKATARRIVRQLEDNCELLVLGEQAKVPGQKGRAPIVYQHRMPLGAWEWTAPGVEQMTDAQADAHVDWCIATYGWPDEEEVAQLDVALMGERSDVPRRKAIAYIGTRDNSPIADIAREVFADA